MKKIKQIKKIDQFVTKNYKTYHDFYGSVGLIRQCNICGNKQYRTYRKGNSKKHGLPRRLKKVCQNYLCRIKFI